MLQTKDTIGKRFTMALLFGVLLGFVAVSCVGTEEGEEGSKGCTEDGQCDQAANEKCVEGFCMYVEPTACQFDTDCPNGEVCDLMNGICVTNETQCPIGRDCMVDIDCTTTNGLVGEGWRCILGCCTMSTDGDNGDGDSGDDDDDDTDGDHTDGDNDLPADHCVNAGCDEFFDCDEESGDCVMGADHCLNEPCLEHFVCNETTGACDPGPDHCNTTGCDTYYQCLEAIGECRPADDHCSNAGCDNHYDCNTESGECEKAQDHCDNTPCPSHFVCNHVSGDCDMDATHCDNAGCALRHTCEQATGDCIPGADHCTTAGCTNNYECNANDGRCYPSQASQSACSGSCDGNTDQYCIDGGNFLCDCDDTLSVLDCEVYCLDEGYPYLEGCSRYTPESGSAYYRCDCGQYPDTMGTCAQPVEIERFPFKHAWDIYNIMGMGAANNLNPNGCTPTGGIVADGPDRVYRLEARGQERYQIRVTTELGDPWVTIRASCGNADTNNWCMSASGTVMLAAREDMTVTIPETGDYFIAVEGAPGGLIPIVSYTLTVTKL